MEDPFFVVKGEVNKALSTVNQLYARWTELTESSAGGDEHAWTSGEIKNNIRSIEWDLEDLTETVGIVEANPLKFKLTPAEIDARRQFIEETRQTITSIRADITSPQAKGRTERSNRAALMTTTHEGNKYAKLENEMVQSNQRYIEDQQMQQQVLLGQQDSQLEQVGKSVGVLKHMGHQIGGELDEQAIILDELNHEIDQTDSKLQTVLVRVEKILRLADDKKQTYVLMALVVMCLIVLILFVAV